MPRTTLHNAGAYLHFLWQRRALIEAECGFALEDALRTLSTCHIERRDGAGGTARTPDALTLRVAEVLFGLLQRGVPTLATLFVEETLLRPLVETGRVRQVSRVGVVIYDLPDEATLPLDWLHLLARAHVVVDPRLGPQEMDEHRFGSRSERDFYCFALPRAVPPGLWQCFELQRPLDELLPAGLAPSFVEQTVDFAATAPGMQLIVEIDGPTHSEAGQRENDLRRDRVVSAAGGRVVRIPVEKRLDSAYVAEVLGKCIAATRFNTLVAENMAAPLQGTPEGHLAMHLVLAPFAIARVQRAILLALQSGTLLIGEPVWRISVIERDVGCAALAVVDFMQQAKALLALMGVVVRVPDVQVTVYREEDSGEICSRVPPLACIAAGVQVEVVSLTDLVWYADQKSNLLIDVAVLQRHGMNPLAAEVRDRVCAPGGVALEVRSAYAACDVRRVSALEPIAYQAAAEAGPALIYFLQAIFRKQTFRDGQVEILQRALALKPVIGLLPTGAGKSICYQLSALLQPGMTLVVDPIISLMEDQIDNLRHDYGIDWVERVSSLQTRGEKTDVVDAMAVGRYKMLLVSPERLHMSEFRDKIAEFASCHPIPYAVLDEAHCISEWGHDFRPSYLRLAQTIRTFCAHDACIPVTIALTGTASFTVLSDVQREIDVTDEQAQVYPASFDRSELKYRIVQVDTKAKRRVLEQLLLKVIPDSFQVDGNGLFETRGEETAGGLIFTPHANGDFGATNVASYLQQRFGLPVGTFTGKSDATAKMADQRRFKQNEIALLVATKAFGMGVDKPNIRYTIHYNIPPSLESFYQESGRSGRDRRTALCWLLFSDDTPALVDAALAPGADEASINAGAENGDGDGKRLLWLHRNTYRGWQAERDDIQTLYRKYLAKAFARGPQGYAVEVVIPFEPEPHLHRVQVDHALHRLVILGTVLDYTYDYRGNQFRVAAVQLDDASLLANLQQYIARYKAYETVDAIPAAIEQEIGQTMLGRCVSYLLRFVYAEIERKRRVALRTMIEVARKAAVIEDADEQDRYMRGELLAYLEKSPFTDALAELALREEPPTWLAVLGLRDDTGALLLKSVDGARQLLGACRRMLESYPEHPGLLFLSSLARMLAPEPDIAQASMEARVAFRRLVEGGKQEALTKLLQAYRRWLGQRPVERARLRSIADEALAECPTRTLARAVYEDSPEMAQRVIYNTILADLRAVNQKLANRSK